MHSGVCSSVPHSYCSVSTSPRLSFSGAVTPEQHQGIDRPGVRLVPEGSGEQENVTPEQRQEIDRPGVRLVQEGSGEQEIVTPEQHQGIDRPGVR